MENLEKELLLHELDRYGYQLARSKSVDPKATVSRMLESDDSRFLEGVPVVLTHMLMSKELVDLDQLERSLPASLQRRFRVLAALTYHFLFWVPDSDAARNSLLRYLRKREPALLEQLREKLVEKTAVNLGKGQSLDMRRLEKTYRNYVVSQFYAQQETLTKQLDNQRQATFQEALAEFFTDKQREVLLKVLNKQQLSKTEREYYSRTIKPRLKALSNPDLHSFATTLLAT